MRKVGGIVFFAFFILVLTVAGRADVTGSFNIHVALLPEGTQTESVQFYFDLQSNLQLNVTISGMTFSADLGFGTTGPEFAVTGFNTNLGAVNINDTFVFAIPFYSAGVYDGTTISQISPTLDGNLQPNGLAFVSKRVRTDMFIGGFVLSNLAIFEDVDFPNPFSTTEETYYVGQTDSLVGNQTPTYGFGDVLTVRGQTVSGLTIESTVGICASKSAKIVKKRAFLYKVNSACTASMNNLIQPIENGAKTPLLFEFEDLAVRNIEIGGIKFNLDAQWLPAEGLSQANLNARFSLFDFATVSGRATFAELAPLTLKSLLVTASSDVVTLNLADTDADLTFDRLSAVFSATLNPNQNPATVQSITVIAMGPGCNEGFDKDNDLIDNCVDDDIDGDGKTNVIDDDIDGDGIDNVADSDDNGDGVSDETPCGSGFCSQVLTLSINRGPLRFSSTTAFSPGPPDIDGDGVVNGLDDDADGDGEPNDTDPTPFGTLPGDPVVTWSSTSLSLDYFLGDNISFSLQATATSIGLMPISASFGITF